MNIKNIPDISTCVEVGYISRPHGTEGEVLVVVKRMAPDVFAEQEYVFLRLQERLVPFYIQSVTLKSNSVFVRFEDIDSLERAEQYVSTKIYVEGIESEEQDEDNADLIGFTVIDDGTKQPIGVVREVVTYSLNVVLDVVRQDGDSVLIPFAEDLLKSYDEEQHTITMVIPEGLFD